MLEQSQVLHVNLVLWALRPTAQEIQMRFRLLEMAGQVFAFRRFDVNGKAKFVVRVPMVFRQQTQGRLQVIQGRCVGGRRLGLASRPQIEPRQHESLRSLRDQAATEIPMVNDVKDLFFNPLGGRTRPQ